MGVSSYPPSDGSWIHRPSEAASELPNCLHEDEAIQVLQRETWEARDIEFDSSSMCH